MNKIFLALPALGLLAACGSNSGDGAAKQQFKIVGSSTVYPFTTAVAEQFQRDNPNVTAVVESTGTGAGMKLFCGGVGGNFPDIENASRQIKKSEFETCNKNGVTGIVEIKVGFDGLTVAHSAGAPDMGLTKTQIFLALAKQVPDKDGKLIDNPYKTWNEIDPSLPATKIEVLGPPPTSGTRDSFHELVMEPGASKLKALEALKKADAKAFEKAWKSLREDGAYVEAGENDNLIVQKLEANADALGVFGYSFLEENSNKIKGVPIDGVAPSYETIAGGEYKVSRPLFIYVKKQHVGVVPGMAEFVTEYVSDKAMGEDGYLAAKGLVTLPPEEAAKTKAIAKDLETLKGDVLM